MATASVCTRCGNSYLEDDEKLVHVNTKGDPMSVKGCDHPVPGATKHGRMKHLHRRTINGQTVDVYVPDRVE